MDGAVLYLLDKVRIALTLVNYYPTRETELLETILKSMKEKEEVEKCEYLRPSVSQNNDEGCVNE
jgi:hypothetical protein